VEDFGIPVTVHGMKVNSGDLIMPTSTALVVVAAGDHPQDESALDDSRARARIIRRRKRSAPWKPAGRDQGG